MCVMFTRSSSLHEAMPLEKIAAIKAKRLKIKRTKIKGIPTAYYSMFFLIFVCFLFLIP